MGDLVEKLRTLDNSTLADNGLIDAAADEIERLRAALIEIRDEPCMDPDGNSQVAAVALNVNTAMEGE